MPNRIIDKLILSFLRANPGAEFRVEDMQERICTSLRAEHIQQALGRLSKRNLVSKQARGRGNHYWTAKKKT